MLIDFLVSPAAVDPGFGDGKTKPNGFRFLHYSICLQAREGIAAMLPNSITPTTMSHSA
jgi:hypothetical protein